MPESSMHGAGTARPPRTLPSGLLPTLLAAGSVLALWWIYHDRSVLVSPQGSQCLRAAHHFAIHGGLDLAPGRPFAWFGPLYPVLLAGLDRLDFPPLSAVVLLNSVALVATFALLLPLARRVAGGAATACVLFTALLASHPYLFRMARPDLFVLPASFLAILGTLRYVESGRRRDLLLAAAGCAVATTARYMAVFPLAPVAAYLLYVAWRHRGIAGRFDAAAFVAIGWVPLALWLLRNRLRTGFLTGMSRTEWRAPSADTSLATNVAGTAKTFALDLFGVRSMGVVSQVYGEVPVPHPVATIALLATGAVAGGWALWRLRRAGALPGPLDDTPSRRAARLVAAWTGTYLVALVALWTWGNNDPIHTRYVAPVYPLLALLAFRAVERRRGAPGAKVALAVAALSVLVPNIEKSVRLLGESPGDALLRVSLHAPNDLWVRDLDWATITPPRQAGRPDARPAP